MFHSARVKLTAWYLLIIMVISVAFSVSIYKVLTLELDRVERAQRLRIERGLPERFRIQIPFDLRDELFRPFRLDTEIIAETKKHLAIVLFWINFGILGTSALAGYFLAGKTLGPIENSLEEQKRFVADASHELRTPLTALKTSMEVGLRDKKMSLDQAKSLIKDNLEEINGMQSLANKLLSLATYQSNGYNLVFEEVAVREVIEDAYRKILPLVRGKEIEVILKIKDQTLRANKESLIEMLLIFLDNSVKYTPEKGKITLTTESDRKNIMIKIKDTGVGIAKEALPHIFDRFYRADQSRSKEKVAGFGLGLPLAKKIIEIHKGMVEVSSVLGKGATFTIKLPLKRI